MTQGQMMLWAAVYAVELSEVRRRLHADGRAFSAFDRDVVSRCAELAANAVDGASSQSHYVEQGFGDDSPATMLRHMVGESND